MARGEESDVPSLLVIKRKDDLPKLRSRHG